MARCMARVAPLITIQSPGALVRHAPLTAIYCFTVKSLTMQTADHVKYEAVQMDST